MAVTKVKRSVHLSKVARRNNRRATNRHLERSKPAERKTQIRSSSQRKPAKPKAQTRRTFVLANPRRTYFPQANGRVVKQVEFFSDSSNNTLEFTFQDDTSLSFEFEPSFVWEAYFARWKSGEQRILHRWR